ncbi:LAFE_0G13454g1_1 [Lachancea fermentati]|uniref:Stress-associated endoplasmic reticulum protein n=1 Tax=Lachancea fermentati TaxID=4955 RepID=A0A1G4MIA6_LACFM|nr:LAFE_0G13454g1_1 [Lachancea fermentati]
MAVQTPKQRIANERFLKRTRDERKLGKRKVADSKPKSRLPMSWTVALLFLLVGGGILELVSLFL